MTVSRPPREIGSFRDRKWRESLVREVKGIDIFTSTDDGLAPASGGGTSNFLRADGTWTTPPGGTSYTDEEAQDAVGLILDDTSTVNLTYDDAGGAISADVIPSGLTLSDLSGSVTMAQLPANAKEASFGVVIGDGATAIITGYKGEVTIPFAGTITGWEITGDAVGSIVVDVWKDSYANFPPTGADTIAGTEKPTLSAARKNQDLALSTWTTSVSAGDIVAFNVDSVSGLNRVRVQVFMERT